MHSYEFPYLLGQFVAFLEHQGKSRHTILAYKKDIQQFAAFAASMEKPNVKNITTSDVRMFIDKLIINEGYKEKSASRKLNSIRTFFKHLKHEGILEKDPALDVSHPKFKLDPPRILSKIEYRALRDASKNDIRTYAMIEIMLQTGIKIGELVDLKLEDFRDDGTLHISVSSKNIERTVPLANSAQNAIKKYLEIRPNTNCNNLFVARSGRPMIIRNIRQSIDNYFEKAGIKKVSVNDLRNTFIAYQLSKGVPIEYVAKIVGHKRLSSTERFLSLVNVEKEKRSQLEEL